MATRRELITSRVFDFLKENPDGYRYSAIVKRISELLPEIPVNTIHGTVWDLDIQYPEKIYEIH